MQAGVFCFFAGGSDIASSNRQAWQWKEGAMLCKIHMHDFKSHFQWHFLAYCTSPVSVHLAVACVGCSLNSFSIFLLFKNKTTTKSHENYVFLYPFSGMAITPQNKNKNVFYTSKLYGLAGMQTHSLKEDRSQMQQQKTYDTLTDMSSTEIKK